MVANVNDRILPGTKFTPREILFRLCFAPIHTQLEIPPFQPEDAELTDRMDLAEIMRMENLAHHITDSECHRAQSNDSATPIEFEVSDLVQVYDPTLDMTHKADRKIAPRWLGPRLVVSKGINSYKLAQLNGTILERNFHTNHLRGFVAQPHSKLRELIDSWKSDQPTGLTGEEFEED